MTLLGCHYVRPKSLYLLYAFYTSCCRLELQLQCKYNVNCMFIILSKIRRILRFKFDA
ncbi:hypothetical protein HORM4_790090 [Vibrio harveyi]|nr:hypothetical protein HORM4_790090 [Vibrio harveyi]